MAKYCVNCKYGESTGSGIKCRKILDDLIFVINGVMEEPTYVVTSLTFSCINHEFKDETKEEEV